MRISDWSSDVCSSDLNLGVRGFQLRTSQFGGEWDWAGIAHALVDAPRHALVRRTTRETRVRVQLDLDMVATPQVSTGLPFFDHMLDQLRSEEHTSELQSLMRISYAVFCLKQKNK